MIGITDIYKHRLELLRKKIAPKGMDAAIISKRENCYYLSGFTGSNSNLIITADDAVLITDFRYEQQAKKQAPDYNVVMQGNDYYGALSDCLKEQRVEKAGFEDNYVTCSTYEEYSSKLGLKEIVPLRDLVDRFRAIKDEHESGLMKTASHIADMAFEKILDVIKPGVSEMDIALELEYFMKKNGASAASFDIIVASGERASMPHGKASSKKICSNEVITLDFGALYNGYCSDMTRTVFTGKPDKEILKIYDIVKIAQEEALNNTCRGLTGKQIDAVARKIITDAGYGEKFGHGLGHGVGIEIHEEPRLSPKSDTVMENGMVVTVEPGIYIEGYGGVRIEDMVQIQDDIPLVFTKSTKAPLFL
jgi:Xaa-Pro aminopeptidase